MHKSGKPLMLLAFITFFLGAALLFIGNNAQANACCSVDAEATCSPTGGCNACKNCKYCKHCSKDGGSCSVCK